MSNKKFWPLVLWLSNKQPDNSLEYVTSYAHHRSLAKARVLTHTPHDTYEEALYAAYQSIEKAEDRELLVDHMPVFIARAYRAEYEFTYLGVLGKLKFRVEQIPIN